MQYPVQIQNDDTGTVLVTFPDVPEAITYGRDQADALHHAAEALETALEIYMDDRKPLPKASPARGRLTVAPGIGAQMKLSLYEAMREAGWRKADLTRRLGWKPPQVDRLFHLKHASRASQMDQAFAALGKELHIVLKPARTLSK